MNRIVLAGIAFSLVLSACSRDEPPAEVAPPEESIVEAPPEMPAEVAESDDETQPELVEESAAEPDPVQDDAQPIVLAKVPEAAETASRQWKFSEGQQYHRLVPTQPTVGGADKIEVAEVFWYGCPHCYSFEPQINGWAASIPPNVRFVRIPAVWNPLARLHGRLYYTGEVLARTGKLSDVEGFHAAVFNEFHNKRNRLTSEDSIQKLFERFGVSKDDFLSTWNSFEVDQKIRVADDLVRRYNVTGVPAMVINGKYRTGGNEAGSYAKVIEVIDELVARESLR